ncbi:MAG: MmgE/PrpD family protein [Rhodospirillaceae bacterium]
MNTKTTPQPGPRGQALAAYIAGTFERRFPPEVLEAARRALVDFVAVAVGACDDAPVKPVRETIRQWNASGKARVFLGGRTTPALAVLANGTMAHAMDYDDTHPGGAGHPSGPCWSTALALTEESGYREQDAMAAFITGYEVMAKLGGGFAPGVGRSLQRKGFHPTSMFGRAGSAAVACALMRLDKHRIYHALANTATTAGGLLGSFGTHGKPFHAGKAAMDGILAAQMGAAGYIGGTQLFELERGLLDAFIQDRKVEVPRLDFENWEILTNGFKLFASCRATHASTQAARSLAQAIGGRKVSRVHAKVHPNALVTAGRTDPRTPLEGKFSVPFCISMALTGHRVVYSDFVDEAMRNAAVMDIVPKVTLEAVEGQAPHSAHLDVYLEDGTHLHADTDIVRGHPDNPLSWDEIRGKFLGLVEPKLGKPRTEALFDAARAFGAPGSMARLSTLLEGDR